MHKKVVIIIIIGFIVLAAGICALFFLHPMLNAQTESSPAYNDAWKLERIQGRWASSDAKYELDVDGYDCALKMDGVYAMVASVQFDASDKLQEGNVRFTLQIAPSSVIYPDEVGAYHCKIDALWYEDGRVFMRLDAPEQAETDPICLLRVTSDLAGTGMVA